jgi:hypothetical protein
LMGRFLFSALNLNIAKSLTLYLQRLAFDQFG